MALNVPVPVDHELVVGPGLDPEEDLETFLLLGHRQHRELSIVDIRQDVPPEANKKKNLF